MLRQQTVKLLDRVETHVKVPVFLHQFVLHYKTVACHIGFRVEFLYPDLELIELVQKVINTVIHFGQRPLE